MSWYNRALEYIIFCAFMTCIYYPVVIPWMILVIHIPIEKVTQFLWQGFIIDLIVAYPAGKLLIKLAPKIKIITGIDIISKYNDLKLKIKNGWEDIVSI